jgi:hypothetical protein
VHLKVDKLAHWLGVESEHELENQMVLRSVKVKAGGLDVG